MLGVYNTAAVPLLRILNSYLFTHINHMAATAKLLEIDRVIYK